MIGVEDIGIDVDVNEIGRHVGAIAAGRDLGKRVPIAIMQSQFLKAFCAAGTADAPKPKPACSG